jgi:hypothetical protein
MSEEHEEHEHQHGQPHPFLMAFAGPTPEQLEHERMRGEATGHETRAFFDSLNIDQLRKLAGILRQVNSDPDAAIYYQGLAAGFIDLKHGICLVCNTDHSKVPEEFTEQHKTEQTVPTDVGINVCCATPVDAPHEYKCPIMVEYNVEPDDDGSQRVMCKGCSKWYVSLDDRILRKPGIEGCDGCQQKSAWG